MTQPQPDLVSHPFPAAGDAAAAAAGQPPGLRQVPVPMSQQPVFAAAAQPAPTDQPTSSQQPSVVVEAAESVSAEPSRLTDPQYGRPASERPKKMWEHIYEIMAAAPMGQVLYWEILGEAVGKDATVPGERSLVNAAARRAIKELEQRDKRTARNVRGYGFKIVSNEERLEIARRHQDRAVKEVSLARKQVTNVDLASMEPNTRKAFELTALALGRQAQVMEQVNIRQDRLETVVEHVLAEQRVDAEDRDQIKARLAALEARLNGGAVAPLPPTGVPHGSPYMLSPGHQQTPGHWPPQPAPNYAGMPPGYPPQG